MSKGLAMVGVRSAKGRSAQLFFLLCVLASSDQPDWLIAAAPPTEERFLLTTIQGHVILTREPEQPRAVLTNELPLVLITGDQLDAQEDGGAIIEFQRKVERLANSSSIVIKPAPPIAGRIGKKFGGFASNIQAEHGQVIPSEIDVPGGSIVTLATEFFSITDRATGQTTVFALEGKVKLQGKIGDPIILLPGEVGRLEQDKAATNVLERTPPIAAANLIQWL